MEAVILMGIPASGKSTFFKQMFADTHVRINGDMLRNKGLERDLIDACHRHGQPYVVDKMNFTRKHREPYLERAKLAGFLRVGYLFNARVSDALRRNRNEDRIAKGLPEVAILNAASKFQRPSYEEGFDRLYFITMDEKTFTFKLVPWKT